ncbi:hypothetical protein AL050_28410 [Pseudomonas syringae pv. daphniphylli]|nr:hypothetical protein AL050_28410 [Pseudomonas syringae pv. daphniphylli]
MLSHTESPRQVLRWFLFRYALDPYLHKFIFEFLNESLNEFIKKSLGILYEFLLNSFEISFRISG